MLNWFEGTNNENDTQCGDDWVRILNGKKLYYIPIASGGDFEWVVLIKRRT